jgi:hypothetical protein
MAGCCENSSIKGGIYLLAEQLATSQKEVCSMKSIKRKVKHTSHHTSYNFFVNTHALAMSGIISCQQQLP